MRDIPVGNGSLLVTFDKAYQIRDIYFPRVGQENHTEGYPCRFGVWVDGRFSWVSGPDWNRELEYLPETLVTDVKLTNDDLEIEIRCHDTVASHDNTFLRSIRVVNRSPSSRDVRIFLHHDLRIYENNFGDTALFDPDSRSIIHYKKHRYFLINTDPPFTQFATGRKAFREKEGTWRDAEDGTLDGGSITEGSVDSTIGIGSVVGGGGTFELYYWIAAGTSYEDVIGLNTLVAKRGAQKYLDYTSNYWRAWLNKNEPDLSALNDRLADLYKRSLLIIHTQIDNGGAILAANDYDVTERATDHYSYLWTRDGAFVANALDLAGYSHLTRKFFDLCSRIVHPEGYFLQKYNADGTVASGWHSSWDPGKQQKLVPIQEDETALVLWALWQHYDRYRDIEFAHRLYRTLTIPCADFMLRFRDENTGLPLPSWNLWEDRHGIHTFTCSAVVAGLRAAANFAAMFAEYDRAAAYNLAAEAMLEGMKQFLFSEGDGRFLRSLQTAGDGSATPDATIDASLFGVFYLGCLPPDDPMVSQTMDAIRSQLHVAGGIARFQSDGYMKTAEANTGNPWFICTIWLAEYLIAGAKNLEDLKAAEGVLNWVCDNAKLSGVLAEQFDPETKEPVSVSPLTWSHSTFVAAAHSYMARAAELKDPGV